jgi:hypothetical protein
VVICSELPTKDGASITNTAEQLAAEAIRYHSLRLPIVWIEITHLAPYLGDTRLSVRGVVWEA